jgi:hypothetical protein
VAGLPSGLPSNSLSGLQYPSDIYVYDNGSILVADFGNNRIMKWDPNAIVGVLVAGTGSYGSWVNLLAKPMALAGECIQIVNGLFNIIKIFFFFTVRDDQLYVSDLDNYRIQVPSHHRDRKETRIFLGISSSY